MVFVFLSENDICKLTYSGQSSIQNVCEATDGMAFSFEQWPSAS